MYTKPQPDQVKKNYLAHEQYHLKSYGLRAFSVAAPILWTGLRNHTKFSKFSIADSIIHFFSQYFYHIYCKVLMNFMELVLSKCYLLLLSAG